MKRRVIWTVGTLLVIALRDRHGGRGAPASRAGKQDADCARHAGRAEADGALDRRAARRPDDDARRATGRRHAAHRDARADRRRGQVGRRRDGVRPGRSAVRARTGAVRAGGSRADHREDEGGCHRAGRRRIRWPCSRRGSTCAAPSWTCRATSSYSPIDAQKNALSLEEAKRRLAQLEEDVKSRTVTNQASLAVSRGAAQQGAALDAARPAGHRQPRHARAHRRRRVAQGEPRRVRRLLLLRHGAAGVPPGGFGLAGPSGRGRHRVGQDGSAREGRRDRPREPHRRDSPPPSTSTRCRDRRSKDASGRCPSWPPARTGSNPPASTGISTSRFSSTSPTRG